MKVALEELTRIWSASSNSRLVNVGTGTRLWHCGRIPSFEHLDGERALWTTCNADRADVYVGFAWEPASWTANPPTQLELVVCKELRAADFAAHSLVRFTQEYCGF